MAEKVVGFSALSHYDSKIKALTVGTIEIAGNVFTFKAVDGTIIGTATLPKTVDYQVAVRATLLDIRCICLNAIKFLFIVCA